MEEAKAKNCVGRASMQAAHEATTTQFAQKGARGAWNLISAFSF
jgi:hypothetical protein